MLGSVGSLSARVRSAEKTASNSNFSSELLRNLQSSCVDKARGQQHAVKQTV
jgi:hypothetical protein